MRRAGRLPSNLLSIRYSRFSSDHERSQKPLQIVTMTVVSPATLRLFRIRSSGTSIVGMPFALLLTMRRVQRDEPSSEPSLFASDPLRQEPIAEAFHG